MTGTAPESGKTKSRKTYAKPVMKRVHLKPDEAVLGGCKTAGTSGPVHALCNAPTPCATIAS